MNETDLLVEPPVCATNRGISAKHLNDAVTEVSSNICTFDHHVLGCLLAAGEGSEEAQWRLGGGSEEAYR